MEAQFWNTNTNMIVFDIKLIISNKVNKIDIFMPIFSLNAMESENKKWIRIKRDNSKINIESNFSTIKALKSCTTYMINPIKCTVLDVYKGFEHFAWLQHEWSKSMRFVFEVQLHSDSLAAQPTVWKHCITEMPSPLNTNATLLKLENDSSIDSFVNSERVACVVIRNNKVSKNP